MVAPTSSAGHFRSTRRPLPASPLLLAALVAISCSSIGSGMTGVLAMRMRRPAASSGAANEGFVSRAEDDRWMDVQSQIGWKKLKDAFENLTKVETMSLYTESSAAEDLYLEELAKQVGRFVDLMKRRDFENTQGDADLGRQECELVNGAFVALQYSPPGSDVLRQIAKPSTRSKFAKALGKAAEEMDNARKKSYSRPGRPLAAAASSSSSAAASSSRRVRKVTFAAPGEEGYLTESEVDAARRAARERRGRLDKATITLEAAAKIRSWNELKTAFKHLTKVETMALYTKSKRAERQYLAELNTQVGRFVDFLRGEEIGSMVEVGRYEQELVDGALFTLQYLPREAPEAQIPNETRWRFAEALGEAAKKMSHAIDACNGEAAKKMYHAKNARNNSIFGQAVGAGEIDASSSPFGGASSSSRGPTRRVTGKQRRN